MKLVLGIMFGILLIVDLIPPNQGEGSSMG